MKAFIIAGLGFGDEGKGTITDAICQKHSTGLVVRYNGGPQAAHRVVTSSGKEHVFSQFGSGTFASAKTLLSEYMLVNPLGMMEEAADLQKQEIDHPLERLMFVDENAIVITPYHIALNRLRELARGKGAHGTCGHGVGETRKQDIERPDLTIRVRDLDSAGLPVSLLKLRAHLLCEANDINVPVGDQNQVSAWKGLFIHEDDLVDLYKQWSIKVNILSSAEVADLINAQETVVFEGAQGILLDQDYGFHPHTTWSDTTMHNAEHVLDKAMSRGGFEYDSRQVTKIGVMRTYMTRHGNGPFVTYDEELTKTLIEARNGNDGPQGNFRCGWLDFAALKYAIAVNGGVDALAITHCDTLMTRNRWTVVDNYDDPQSGQWTPGVYRLDTKNKEREFITAMMFQSRLGARSEEPSSLIPAFVENELQIPILITSHGPTAEDKQFHEAKTQPQH
jgi:adenylosuccinate synthase